jgi:hypothetical protein
MRTTTPQAETSIKYNHLRCRAASIVGCCGLVLGSMIAAHLVQPAMLAAQGAAEKKHDPKKAKAHHELGKKLYKEGSYDAALVEFQRAYELSGDYRMLYNISAVYQDQRNYVKAVHALEQFLVEGGKRIDRPHLKEANDDIARLKKRIGKLKIVVNVEGAEIRIDDEKVGQSPLAAAVEVNAGRRKISARLDGHQPTSEIVSIAAGEEGSVTLKLTKNPTSSNKTTIIQVPQNAPPKSPPPPPKPPPSKFTTLSWIGLGTAGVLAIGAGVTGVLALGASSDLKNKRFASDSEAEGRQNDAKTFSLVSDVLTGAALVTAGVTLVFTLTRHPESESVQAQSKQRPQVKLGVGPRGAQLVGTF